MLIGARQAALALVAGLQPEECNLVSGFEWRVGKGRIFLQVSEFGQRKDGQLLGLVVLPVILLVELGFEAADLQLRALVAKRKALHPLFQNYIILPSRTALVVSDVRQSLPPSPSPASTASPQQAQLSIHYNLQRFFPDNKPFKKLGNYNKNI